MSGGIFGRPTRESKAEERGEEPRLLTTLAAHPNIPPRLSAASATSSVSAAQAHLRPCLLLAISLAKERAGRT